MPTYLIEASYSAEGAKGIMKRGGTAPRAEVQKMVESLWTPYSRTEGSTGSRRAPDCSRGPR
jgi:hypothetical protein